MKISMILGALAIAINPIAEKITLLLAAETDCGSFFLAQESCVQDKIRATKPATRHIAHTRPSQPFRNSGNVAPKIANEGFTPSTGLSTWVRMDAKRVFIVLFLK